MSVKSGLVLSAGGMLGPLFIKVFGKTWRIRQSSPSFFQRRKSGSTKRVVYSSWHRNVLFLGYFARNQGVCVLISEHRDGELIARIVRRLGFSSFRGSTTRGAVKALRALDRIKNDPSNCDIAITPDGPRGPAKKLQKGIIYTASRTGFSIVPVGVAVDRSWEARSWDRFRIPKPFSRCYVQLGDEVSVPENLDSSELEKYRAEVEERMYSAEELALRALENW